MGNHRGEPGFVSHFDRVEGFCQRADLVDLDEDRVGTAFFDAAGQELYVGYE